MLENINIHSSVSVYEQIENHVQFAIAGGQLKSGDQLPSLHELSARFKVNQNTVDKAYHNLAVMGIVWARRGMGVFVAEGVEAKCREECRKRIVARLYEVTVEARSAGVSSKEIKEAIGTSYSSSTGPYGKVPEAILALAKKKK